MTELRPIVARKGKDRTPLLFASAMVIVAVLLFALLNSRRLAEQTPAETAAPAVGYATSETVPDLQLPEPAPMATAPIAPVDAPPPAIVLQHVPQQAVIARPRVLAPPLPSPSPAYVPPPPPPLPITESASSPPPQVSALAKEVANATRDASSRITASRIANPATTVPQGTLIGAVLETALDSTGAGQARALVTRNVYGFDGSKLLIPRGSRLYGVYQAGAEQGQKRALVRWTRLIRPDGVTIDLDSAASDPLGRAGIKGKVNSHFLARFGNALLSTTVGLGDAL